MNPRPLYSPTCLTGTIDLAFLEPEGWVIADYKSDRIEGDIQSFVDYYAPQIKLYAKYWSEITEKPVKEAGLYSCSVQRWVRIG